MKYIFFALLGLVACSQVSVNQTAPEEVAAEAPWDQWAVKNPSWVEPYEPFQIMGPVYYVGAKGIGSFLITGSQGHILLDGGMPQNAPMIAQNIENLGFELQDVKILLNSHAHFDHSGGLAALKEKTGARLLAHEGDRSALEGGFYLGAKDKEEYSAPPVSVDDTLIDGQVIELGDISLTAHLTPGHTRGCTSFSMPVVDGGKSYETLFFCSASVAGNRLVGPPQYEGIVEDYKTTFAKAKEWHPNILLANHPFYFDMEERRERQKSGEQFAFVDGDAFSTLMAKLETDFKKKLAQQTHDAFFENVSGLCGKAFAGKLVSTDEVDADFTTKPMVMHVTLCTDTEIRIPFHVDEDRSRTWVITKTDIGLRLKHDHRHEDGSEDKLTQYGGDTIAAGDVTLQAFPADQFSKDLFVKEDIPVSAQNTWSIEIRPDEIFAYRMERPNRSFRVEFDLTEEVAAPPPAW